MLGPDALDRLFRTARTHSRWLDRPVGEDVLRGIWDLARMGPTSANCLPARLVFVISPQAKARLRPALLPGNVDKTMAAPVTVIVGQDLDFPEHLPRLFPHADAKSWFAGNEALIQATALRNSSLQAAYVMLAARALGLDCGPMSGFDAALVEAEFFAGTNIKANMLINLGYGDPAGLHERGPRFAFDEVCRVV